MENLIGAGAAKAMGVDPLIGLIAGSITNLQAICARYGAAPRAFIIVAVVGAFLIDIANALVISAFEYAMPVLWH
jgi:ESS family glutamate:Na+ symporter